MRMKIISVYDSGKSAQVIKKLVEATVSALIALKISGELNCNF